MSDGGEVRPFLRRGTPPTQEAKPSETALHRRTRQAQAGARALAAEQALEQRQRYARAVSRQREGRLLAEGRPVPARITMALDFRGLEGPEVDTACGAAKPDVDMWEAGREVPTAEQVKLLSALTGFPISYFYMPVEPGPLLKGPVWVCSRSGPKGGRCEAVESQWVDERGVLHYADEARTGDEPAQGALF